MLVGVADGVGELVAVGVGVAVDDGVGTGLGMTDTVALPSLAT